MTAQNIKVLIFALSACSLVIASCILTGSVEARPEYLAELTPKPCRRDFMLGISYSRGGSCTRPRYPHSFVVLTEIASPR